MSEWDKRAEAYEKAFEMDEALRFKVLARRNRLLAAWVAEKRGLNGDAADAYVRTWVADQVGRDDDQTLAEDLSRELAGVEPPISAHRIARRIEEFAAAARRDIFAA